MHIQVQLILQHILQMKIKCMDCLWRQKLKVQKKTKCQKKTKVPKRNHRAQKKQCAQKNLAPNPIGGDGSDDGKACLTRLILQAAGDGVLLLGFRMLHF